MWTLAARENRADEHERCSELYPSNQGEPRRAKGNLGKSRETRLVLPIIASFRFL